MGCGERAEGGPGSLTDAKPKLAYRGMRVIKHDLLRAEFCRRNVGGCASPWTHG